MNKLSRLLFVGALQWAAVGAALADSGLDQIRSAGVFKIGTEGTYLRTSTKYFGEDVSH